MDGLAEELAGCGMGGRTDLITEKRTDGRTDWRRSWLEERADGQTESRKIRILKKTAQGQ